MDIRVKNRYFEISEGVLNVLDNVSPRDTLYGTAKVLLMFYAAVIVVLLVTFLLKTLSLAMVFFYLKSPISIFLFNIIPLILLIIAPRFPPAAKVSFHYGTRTVKWSLQEYSLEVPFEKIHFRTDRILSKTGGSSIGVAVNAIDTKPLFPNDPPPKNSGDTYVKVLWGFYCGSKVEADEMIEIIKSFMAGRYDDSPSKFDDI
jgi:hypothetical protein